MYSVEAELKGILVANGFPTAAEEIDLRGFSKKVIRGMINTWKNFPKSMEVYPTTLSKKIYDEQTQQYTIVT